MKQTIKLSLWRSQRYMDLNREYFKEMIRRKKDGAKKITAPKDYKKFDSYDK